MVDFIKYDIIGNFFLGLYEDLRNPKKPLTLAVMKLNIPTIDINYNATSREGYGGLGKSPILKINTDCNAELKMTSTIVSPIQCIKLNKLEDYDNYRDEFYLAALNLKEYEIEDIIYE